ncbi:MAG: DUF4368 domain-containing protein [Clostridia bacterium]|nr:DUF4368 domain-containing protein [Clostridia bacterium]
MTKRLLFGKRTVDGNYKTYFDKHFIITHFTQLQENIKALEAQINAVAKDNENLERFLNTLRYYVHLEELTPEILHSLVDRIEVGQKVRTGKTKTQSVKIIYNFVGAVEIPQ